MYYGPDGEPITMTEWAAMLGERLKDIEASEAWWRKRTRLGDGVEVELLDEAVAPEELFDILGGELRRRATRYRRRRRIRVRDAGAEVWLALRVELEHPDLGCVQMPGVSIAMSATPTLVPRLMTPLAEPRSVTSHVEPELLSPTARDAPGRRRLERGRPRGRGLALRSPARG